MKNASCKKPVQVSTVKIPKLSPVWMVFGSAGYLGYRYVFNGSNIVHCEHREFEKPAENNFDWNTFLSYLTPDLFNLLAAIVVSKVKY